MLVVRQCDALLWDPGFQQPFITIRVILLHFFTVFRMYNIVRRWTWQSQINLVQAVRFIACPCLFDQRVHVTGAHLVLQHILENHQETVSQLVIFHDAEVEVIKVEIRVLCVRIADRINEIEHLATEEVAIVEGMILPFRVFATVSGDQIVCADDVPVATGHMHCPGGEPGIQFNCLGQSIVDLVFRCICNDVRQFDERVVRA